MGAQAITAMGRAYQGRLDHQAVPVQTLHTLDPVPVHLHVDIRLPMTLIIFQRHGILGSLLYILQIKCPVIRRSRATPGAQSRHFLFQKGRYLLGKYRFLRCSTHINCPFPSRTPPDSRHKRHGF